MKLSDELRSIPNKAGFTKNWPEWDGDSIYFNRNDASVAIRAADELDRLTAALPKTADGVTIVPGMEVWQRASIKEFEVVSVSRKCVEVASVNSINERCFTTCADRFYSTRTAAEEATK